MFSSWFSLFLLLFFSVLGISSADPEIPLLDPDEQESAYLVLEAMNSAINWRALYPDNLCLSAPHGVVCDYYAGENFTSTHIAELSFGFVSDYSSNPPCGPNPQFTPHLSSFPFLRKLFFYKCFTGHNATLPEYFWDLPTFLEELVFVENPSLVGPLDGRIGNFTRLRRLILTGTGISGNVPDSVGKLRQLEQLVISRSFLTGELPRALGKLKKLKILDLSYNSLNGNLPPELGEMSSLIKLDLGFNRIEGRVPDSLSGLQSMELLDLSYNRFGNFGIPLFLAEMPRLREVYLSGNELGGRIPEIWEKLGGILGIGLSGVGLAGNIPRSMGVFLENVCYLSLDNNMLEGKVPEELGLLGNVKEMNLENNRLSGEIPFSANFSAKKLIKLAGNPNLCVNSDRSEGHFGDLTLCPKTAMPDAVLVLSGVNLPHAAPLIYVFGFLFIFFTGL